jgi:hypothetical protein
MVVTLQFLMKMCDNNKKESFLVLMGKEQKKGLVERPDPKTFSITALGLASTDPVPQPKSQEELTAMIKKIFKISDSGTAAKIFEMLLDGETHSLADIAGECGYDPKDKTRMPSFKVMLRSLIAKDVVFMESTDMYRIADMCIFNKNAQ